MTRIVFVNRYFWPDHSATAQMLGDVAAGLAARGMAVAVITGRGLYDDARARLPARETWQGVEIRRVATTRFGRAHLPARALDYLSFYIAAWIEAVRGLRRDDVLVVKTDPPLLGVVLHSAARLRGARVVNWLQDVYPEVAAALGVGIAAGPSGRLLAMLRDRSLRRADANVLIGARMAARLYDARAADRTRILHNFTDDAAIVPRPGDAALRAQWGLDPAHLVVGYSGNLGRSHDVATMLDAASALRDAGVDDVRFLFVGGGHLRVMLADEVARRGLTSVVVRPYQPRALLPRTMVVPDIHWMSLKPALEGLIVPSKFYSAAASGRPILFVGAPDGEIARMIRDAGAGHVVAPGDGARAAAVLRMLRDDPAVRVVAGAAARALIDRHHARERTIDRWAALLGAVAASRPLPSDG